MTRSNRYILPGYTYHLIHRCHNRKFLLKCRLDKTEYNSRLRDAVRKHHISLLDFAITSNHVHLAAICRQTGDLSQFMQQLEGASLRIITITANIAAEHSGKDVFIPP